jgi:hypothetical protein
MMPRETDDNTYVTFYKLKITLWNHYVIQVVIYN